VSKHRLLLADDSVTIQKVVNLTFADEGIDVVTVGDGDAAMEKVAENRPDIILADVHMPGLNGYQICEIIRQNPATRELPVILLVGSFEPFDESEAERVGANAYLTKPFQSIRQLVSQVTELLQSTAAPVEDDVAEFVPTADLPETGDIESLYQRSVGEPEPESDEGETGPPRYVDAGMDDEMIETSYVENDDDSHVEDGEGSGAADAGYGYDEPYDQAASAATMANSPFESAASESGAASASAPAMSGETDVDEFAATEQIQLEEFGTSRDLDLEEVELLELPPIDSGKTLEFTTTQSMMAQGGTKEVVSLSPELMEMIVQKVVDKLSEKY
jgi:CheY-like chemotaxis protein